MKRKTLSSLALLWFSLMLTSVMVGATPYRCIPNEIIVKFKGPAADTIEKQLQNSTDTSSFQLLSSHTSRFNAKYRVSRIEPLLKNFSSRQKQFSSLREQKGKFLTQKQKHILERLKRAPKATQVPDLGGIYKIQLDCESRQSLEEALTEYRNDPNVEYAELNFKLDFRGF